MACKRTNQTKVMVTLVARGLFGIVESQPRPKCLWFGQSFIGGIVNGDVVNT